MRRMVWLLAVFALVLLALGLFGCSGGDRTGDGGTIDTAGRPTPPDPPPPGPPPANPSGWIYALESSAYKVKWDASARESLGSKMCEVSHTGVPFLMYTRDIDPGTYNVLSLFASRQDGTGEVALISDAASWRIFDVALSDDDSRLALTACAWTGTADGAGGIYVTDLQYDSQGLPQPFAMAQATKVTNLTGGQDEPVWSPDKTRIAFTQMPNPSLAYDRDLYVVNVSSGAARLVVDTSSSASTPKPDWSPDGARIAFTREIRAKSGSLKAREIWTVKPDGTDLKVAVSATNTALTHQTRPAWSPDGAWITAWAYAGTSSASEGYIVRSPASGSGTAVRVATTGYMLSELIWRLN